MDYKAFSCSGIPNVLWSPQMVFVIPLGGWDPSLKITVIHSLFLCMYTFARLSLEMEFNDCFSKHLQDTQKAEQGNHVQW